MKWQDGASKRGECKLHRKALVQTLGKAYKHIGGLQGLKNRYRPYVCPMSDILEQIPEGVSLFDIGCGSGSLLCLGKAFRKIKRAVGYDVSPLAVEASRAVSGVEITLRGPEDGVPSFVGYQAVTVVDVLHHIPPQQQKQFLIDIVQNMDVGSRLIIADIDAGRWVGALMNRFHDLLLARQWVHPWPALRVSEALKALGCREEHFSLHRTLWYPHFVIRVVKECEV